MIYVVLGMHKSGTSLVSEILHHSGVRMGEDEDIVPGRAYDQGNKYERSETFVLNNDILGSHDLESIKIPVPDTLTAGEETRSRMERLIAELEARDSDWGFKDPRVCLTYPLWESVLPDHRIVGVYRSLYDLTVRYGADRSLHRAYRLVTSWHEHNQRIVSYLERTSVPWILLNYGRLMEGEEELKRLERFVGRPLEDRRRQTLRRGAPRRGLRMRAAEAVYGWRTGRRAETTLQLLDRYAGEGSSLLTGGPHDP